MAETSLDQQRLAFEQQRHADEFALARERLSLESRQAGRFSAGAVTIIGAAIAVLSAVATAVIGGISGYLSTSAETSAQIDIKRTEVEGQLAVQRLIAEAERDRLALEQKFEIIVQATKGLPPETASENLLFFVEAGILPDDEGLIRGLAEKGRAPDLPVPGVGSVNPLAERVAALGAGERAQAPAPSGFRVENGVLFGNGPREVRHLETPNLGETNDPKYVVLHFTASLGPGAVAWLSQPTAKASTHLLIDRAGAVTQLLPFDYSAWHAGRSSWGALSGLNRHSIGIDLKNAGRLSKGGDGWAMWNGKVVPEAEVLIAVHKNESDEAGWHRYTDAQIDALRDVLKAIVAAYPSVVDLLGHDDIAPVRKNDPGPALPIEDLRQAVFGRRSALPPPG